MTGCSAGPGNVPDPAPTMETEEMPLSPEAPSMEVQHQYTLYFGLSDESFLASEARLVTVPQGGRVEDALVAALIRGPGVSTAQLVAVINPQTKIVRIEESQDYLYITLSREFLEPVFPVTEENLSPERQEALRMRMMMLATYSIVNTVTELGRYSRVQILIDYDNSGEGTRPSRTMLGLSAAGDADADSMVSTLARQDSLVLNPQNTVETLMKAFVEKNWNRAEKFCAQHDSQTDTIRPGKEDFVAGLTLQNPELLSYLVKVQNVSVDGQNAVVMVDVQMRSKAGATVSGTDIPLRLLREGGIWKLSYSSMELLFNIVG
jgi:hypothetical protein